MQVDKAPAATAEAVADHSKQIRSAFRCQVFLAAMAVELVLLLGSTEAAAAAVLEELAGLQLRRFPEMEGLEPTVTSLAQLSPMRAAEAAPTTHPQLAERQPAAVESVTTCFKLRRLAWLQLRTREAVVVPQGMAAAAS